MTDVYTPNRHTLDTPQRRSYPPRKSSLPPTPFSYSPKKGFLSKILKHARCEHGKALKVQTTVSPPPPPPPPKDPTPPPSSSENDGVNGERGLQRKDSDYYVFTSPKETSPRSGFNDIAFFVRAIEDVAEEPVHLTPYVPSKRTRDRSQSHSGSGALQHRKSISISAEERAKRRAEAAILAKAEEERAAREEELRQARVQWEKEVQRREEEETEERRRVILAEELMRATVERAKKEREMAEREQQMAREMEERKRRMREKVSEDSRRSEEWRKEKLRIAEEAAQRKEEERRRAEEDKRARIEEIKCRVVKSGKGRAGGGQSEDVERIKMGWVTIQTPEHLSWKRRYYHFVDESVCFYRSPKDMQTPFETINLRNRIRGLKEWYEGYEELESIPHSFAIEFIADGDPPWSVFSDSEEEKIIFLGLLHQLSGLDS